MSRFQEDAEGMASRRRVAVAMSGGVDSSVAAALLKQQGHEVVGLTMQLVLAANRAPQHFSAVEAARRAADRLGIAHHAVDLSERFGSEVIDYFVGQYAVGRTPNPCMRCNPRIKFGALYEKARELGAEFLATGHYARIENRHGYLAVRRAADRSKDQTYVLAGLSQDQLSHALFPLGGQTKEETREIARGLGLDNAERPESQEICFVPEDDYRRFLAERLGPPTPGPILSVRGDLLGQHRGLMHYTIGQRKGMGIAAPRPLYVIRLDVARNALIVGFEEETYCAGLTAHEPNWSGAPLDKPIECTVQVRYSQTPVPSSVTPISEGFAVHFHAPMRGVAPGQWAVLYDGDYVLGCGVIQDSTAPQREPSL